MRRTLTIAALTAGLALTACGSDGDSASDLSEAQAAAAQSAIDGAAEDGITLDESCVNDIAAQLSDEDAELAAAEGDDALSPEGEALTVSLLTCADEDALVDLFIQGMSESGPTLDEDCARDELERFDVVEVLTAAGEGSDPPQDFIDALTPCFGE
jgi:hypothetical protein